MIVDGQESTIESNPFESFVENKLSEQMAEPVEPNETEASDPQGQEQQQPEQTEQTETENLEPEQTESETQETESTESDFEPDFKYTVLDQEKEFDDRIKAAITDKESEEYFRDLVTKAEGLDTYKEKLESKTNEIEQVKQEYTQTQSQYEQLKGGVEQLDQLLKQDFGTFQKHLDIPDKAVLDRARQILELQENPQEKARVDSYHQQQIDGLRNQNQMQQLQQQNSQLAQRQHEQDVQMAINQPEIKTFQQHFDQRMGEGAFRRHVEQYGALEYQQKQRYVQPLEAVQTVYNQYKNLLGNENAMTVPGSNAQSQGNTQQQAPTTPQQEQKANPPKPPSSLGSGVNQTATKRRVKTLADLYKLADEAEQEQMQQAGY